MQSILTPDIGLIFWMAVAFVILLIVLRKYAWNPILNALHNREKTIEDALSAADEAKKEMEQLKADNDKLIKEAKEERGRILAEAKETKEKIINEAHEKAKADADKIMQEARAEIENQKAEARTEMKNQAAKLAIEVSEKILRRELSDSESQEKYVNELVEDFSPNPN